MFDEHDQIVENPEITTETESQDMQQSDNNDSVSNLGADSTANDSISRNMRAMREKNERLEEENRRMRREYEQFLANQKQKSESDDEDFNLGDDDIVEGKHLAKLKKQNQRLQQEVRNASAELKLRSHFNDFDSVVNEENIARLSKEHPELARTLSVQTDLYSAGSAAYKLIKMMGISEAPDLHAREREMVQRNASKPRPMASVSPQQGESPLNRANAFANGLTPELQKQLWKEIEDARRGSL